MTDKNQAMINYLLQCPTISDNPLFFNFSDQKDNFNQVVTESTNVILNKPYIDGTVLRKHSFTIVSYKSASFNPVVKLAGYPDENISDLSDLQGILDWVRQQADLRNFPNFGTDCVIDSIETTTDTPTLIGINSSLTPPLAKYTITINVTYLDISKKLWS